jgi:CII-binding regulator of phage lambda lysogenization HflD
MINKKVVSWKETVKMSILIIGVLFCVYFEVSVGNPQMEVIQRLEKMVNDLQKNSRVQDQKILSIISENATLKERISEMSRENIQIMQDISHLQTQNQRQTQINSELTVELAEINKNIKTVYQTKANGALKVSVGRLNRLHKVKKQYYETIHAR